MAKNHLSEKQIAEDKRNDRAIFIAIGGFCAMFAASIGLLFAGSAHFISMWLVNLTVVALLATWLLFVFQRTRPAMLLSHESPDDYMSENVDIQHHRWRFAILMAILFMCQSDGFLTQAILKGPLHSHIADFAIPLLSWTFAFLSLAAVLTVAFGPGFFLPYVRRILRDELVRAQQAKTVQFGYLLAVFEMVAVLVMAAYKPQWVIAALPSVVTAAIVLPGIYYMVLQWWADRDE